jgi:hypothetical protein
VPKAVVPEAGVETSAGVPELPTTLTVGLPVRVHDVEPLFTSSIDRTANPPMPTPPVPAPVVSSDVVQSLDVVVVVVGLVPGNKGGREDCRWPVEEWAAVR